MRKKFRFRITVFSGIVLAVIVMLLFGADRKKENILFDSDTDMVLYAKTEVGTKPVFKAEQFFPGEELDYGKFSYDMENCDWNEPGTYQIPVFYGERKTNCRIELKVVEKGLPKIPDLSGDKTKIQ